MPATVSFPLAVALSYLLGSVPFGLVAGLVLKRIDIRQHGSRNIGATNAMRVLGRPIGIGVHVLDIGKGFVPAFCFPRLFLPAGHPLAPALGIACGLAAIVGHVFPIYLRFRGGKGMATSLGVFLGLAWLPTLVAMALWAVVRQATRYVSVASMAAIAAIPLGMAFLPDPFAGGARTWCRAELVVFGAAVAALVIARHRANIARLLQGAEHKIGERAGPEVNG